MPAPSHHRWLAVVRLLVLGSELLIARLLEQEELDQDQIEAIVEMEHAA